VTTREGAPGFERVIQVVTDLAAAMAVARQEEHRLHRESTQQAKQLQQNLTSLEVQLQRLQSALPLLDLRAVIGELQVALATAGQAPGGGTGGAAAAAPTTESPAPVEFGEGINLKLTQILASLSPPQGGGAATGAGAGGGTPPQVAGAAAALGALGGG